MDAERAGKIAEALGFKPGGDDHWWITDDLIPKERIDYIENFESWQAEYGAGDDECSEGWYVERGQFDNLLKTGDPLLEKMIRDRVRKLWCAYVTLPLGTGDYNQVCYLYQGKRHTVYLKRHISDARHAPCFSADTEAAAFIAVLLWLAERKADHD